MPWCPCGLRSQSNPSHHVAIHERKRPTAFMFVSLRDSHDSREVILQVFWRVKG